MRKSLRQACRGGLFLEMLLDQRLRRGKMLLARMEAAGLIKRSVTCTTLLSLFLILLQGMSALTAQENGSGPWVATAKLSRNNELPGGAAVYLGSGLVLTAAHLIDPTSETVVVISGKKLPAKILKQGVYEDIDLSLLFIDQSKLPLPLPAVGLCTIPPWPGDPVVVIDGSAANRSTIAAPSVLHQRYQYRFPTLITDVATTGNSGSGVFDEKRKCLLGIMSRKFTTNGPNGPKDIAKYFVAADVIRSFMRGIEVPNENQNGTDANSHGGDHSEPSKTEGEHGSKD